MKWIEGDLAGKTKVLALTEQEFEKEYDVARNKIGSVRKKRGRVKKTLEQMDEETVKARSTKRKLARTTFTKNEG